MPTNSLKSLQASVLLVFVAMLFISGCQVEQLENAKSFRHNNFTIIEATYELPDVDTKTVRDDKAKIYWTPGDAISLFYGSGSDGGSKFVAQNEAVSLKTTFAGYILAVTGGSDIDEDENYFWGLYPYDKTASCDGRTVTMSIPSVQPGMEGTFAPGMAPSLGRSTRLTLSFRNIWSGFGFTVSEPGFQSLTFKGNNNEDLAGRAKIGIDDNGLPYVVEILEGVKEVTLTAPTSAGFVPGVYYYMQFFPGTLSSGFTVTISSATKIGTWVYEESMEYPRSTWKRAAEVDRRDGIVWQKDIQFEDANFKAYCVENFDNNLDGEISIAEALLVTNIECNDRSITSLSGIEHFVNLTSLSCNSNQLTSLDLSQNAALQSLSCKSNQLTNLEVSNNIALEYLLCSNNQLTSLDVSNNTLLEHLYCYDNQLTSLDVSKNTELKYLFCYENQLTSLDVSENTLLRELFCFSNQLSSLDVSKNTEIIDLRCGDNQLSSLDVSKNTELKYLNCRVNQLTSLDVSNNIALTSLSCGSNQLTSLDLSKNTALTELFCGLNQLTSLDLSKNTALKYLSCYSNQLESLDVSKCSELLELECYSNQLTILDVSNNDALEVLHCYTNPNLVDIWLKTGQTIANFQYDTTVATVQYKDASGSEIIAFEDANFKAYCVENFDKDNDGEISKEEALLVTSITVNPEVVASLKGIEFFANLQSLDCHLQWERGSSPEQHFYRNGEEVFSILSSLDLSGNTALTSLICSAIQLTSLDVSKNTALTDLKCSYNQLTSLDVSKNTALTTLWCYNNQLTYLDVSNNTALTSLDCGFNQLTNLDVSKNTALNSLNFNNNQLISLDLSHNTTLSGLSCSDNQLASLDLSHNTALTFLYCVGNQLTSLDLSHNTALNALYCGFNPLTSLDVSMNTALTTLYCYSNPDLVEIWLKPGQTIDDFHYNSSVSTIKYKDALGNEVISFADANFKDYCVGKFDTNQDGEISMAEALAVTSISVGTNDISSLGGIEFFRNLISLKCEGSGGTYSAYPSRFQAGGQLTELDVSHFMALDTLICDSNHITELDVSNNTNLRYLDCNWNPMTRLNLGDNVGFLALYYGYTYLNELPDLSKYDDLLYLGCEYCNYGSLDVSHMYTLTTLSCRDNQLTSLDVSHNTALAELFCGGNHLTSLDVSKNTGLVMLSCNNNQLTSIDVSHNTWLATLWCNGNQLTSLDVSNNTALSSLNCSSNPNLVEIWLKTGQTIDTFQYDTSVATIKYK